MLFIIIILAGLFICFKLTVFSSYFASKVAGQSSRQLKIGTAKIFIQHVPKINVDCF